MTKISKTAECYSNMGFLIIKNILRSFFTFVSSVFLCLPCPCLFVWLSICLSLCLSVCLFLSLSVCLSVFLSPSLSLCFFRPLLYYLQKNWGNCTLKWCSNIHMCIYVCMCTCRNKFLRDLVDNVQTYNFYYIRVCLHVFMHEWHFSCLLLL